jgi:hypothetical protein
MMTLFIKEAIKYQLYTTSKIITDHFSHVELYS